MSWTGNIKSKFVAWSVPFRTTAGKIYLAYYGKLTPAQLAKYALKEGIKPELRKAVISYIILNPKTHASVMEELVPYLSSPVVIRKRDGSLLYPERMRTVRLLEDIVGVSPGFAKRKEVLLCGAPPLIEEKK
ncbi:MAG: hypothetical protein WC903_04295 [Candidatus Margulisiibacteriota bacterium]